MQFHEIQPIHKPRKHKRVGRGGRRGTYCGKGIKGQKSRAGRKMMPAIRELIKRYPKLKGYRFKGNLIHKAIVNIEILDKKFENGQEISPKFLLENKIVRRINGRTPIVKILGKGKISKKFIVIGCEVSKSAKVLIEKAGGSVKEAKLQANPEA